MISNENKQVTESLYGGIAFRLSSGYILTSDDCPIAVIDKNDKHIFRWVENITEIKVGDRLIGLYEG